MNSKKWDWKGANILVTGGTGSFGKKFIELMLTEYEPERVIVFSRDELKQHEMRSTLPEDRFPQIRYFIGDIRDRDRLNRAFDGVDLVVHAAALKQVPTAEYNPMEAVLTNISLHARSVQSALPCHRLWCASLLSGGLRCPLRPARSGLFPARLCRIAPTRDEKGCRQQHDGQPGEISAHHRYKNSPQQRVRMVFSSVAIPLSP